MSMSIPNSAVFAGGALVFLSFAGLAFFFFTKQNRQDTADTEMTFSSIKNAVDSSIEEVVPLPKSNMDENALSKQLETVEKFQEQKQEPPPPPVSESTPTVDATKPTDDVDNNSSGNLSTEQKVELSETNEELKEDFKTYTSLTISQGKIRFNPGVHKNVRALL